jgi:hypothetical protein
MSFTALKASLKQPGLASTHPAGHSNGGCVGPVVVVVGGSVGTAVVGAGVVVVVVVGGVMSVLSISQSMK